MHLQIAVSLITLVEALKFGKNWALMDPDARWAIANYGTLFNAPALLQIAGTRMTFALTMIHVTPAVG